MNIPKNTRTRTRKTEKQFGKNIFRKTKNCWDKSFRIDNIIKHQICILTINENMIFYNDTIIKIVWRHGRKEI